MSQLIFDAPQERRVQKQLTHLLDEGTFYEFAPFLTRRLDQKNPPSDGVVAGFGKIDGRRVAVFAQDAGAENGTFSEMGGQKIGQLLERAREGGLPVIGLYDSTGPCPKEGIYALTAPAELIWQQTQNSGLVPQIAIVTGSASGALAISVGLADFVIALEGISMMQPAWVTVLEVLNPGALDEAVRAGEVRRGDVLLMTAFGAGLTWAGAVLRL